MAVASPPTPAVVRLEPIHLSPAEALTCHTALTERMVRCRLDLMVARDLGIVSAIEREIDTLERLRTLVGVVAGIR